jgi:L-arabinose isomerase
MRDVAVTEGDKVEAQLRFGVSVNTYGVNDLVALVDEVSDAEVDALIEEYADAYEIVPELTAGGDRHESLRYGARIEAGLRAFLTDGGFGAFTTNFQDLGGLRQLPGLAVQRLMADGYGFGGEGDWKTSVMLHTLKAMGSNDSGGTSFMEDYTYHWGPGTPKILGAHMLEVCPSIAAGKPRVEIHPLSIGIGRIRYVWCSTPNPVPPLWSAFVILVIGSGWCSTRSPLWSPTSRCPNCRWRVRYGSRLQISPPQQNAGWQPGGHTTRSCRAPSTPSSWSTLPTCSASSC